MDWDYLDKDGH